MFLRGSEEEFAAAAEPGAPAVGGGVDGGGDDDSAGIDLPKHDRTTLLRTLKKIFGESSAFTLLAEFMDAHGIRYTSYTWA